jgi:hypothetical protein
MLVLVTNAGSKMVEKWEELVVKKRNLKTQDQFQNKYFTTHIL